MKIEIRTCIKCGETKEIPQKLIHSTNVCDDCKRAASREYQRIASIKKGKRSGIIGRLPYPLPEGYKATGNYFKSLSVKSFRIKDRKEWIEYFRKRLDEIFQNEEVMNWINAHKDNEPIKRQKKIETDYPDTRNLTWEDYEKGGWGEPEDS